MPHLTAHLFLSTLSLRRATPLWVELVRRLYNFYPRSPCGERLCVCWMVPSRLLFLSTLSLRRATPKRVPPPWAPVNFYPRSPCGERLDKLCEFNRNNGFLSTLSLRRATTDTTSAKMPRSISIHALLAESDVVKLQCIPGRRYFYPRSPCGERHHRFRSWPIPRDNFYPRSPCGERRDVSHQTGQKS